MPRCLLLRCRIALQTRGGREWHVDVLDPEGRRASRTAFTTVGGAPMVPDSPIPLMPSGLVRAGISIKLGNNVRNMLRRGIA